MAGELTELAGIFFYSTGVLEALDLFQSWGLVVGGMELP